MSSTLEKLLQDIEDEKENLNLRISRLKSLPIEELETAFPEGFFSHYIGNFYSFSLPMRFELVAEFKKYVENREGWKLSGERQHVWDEKNAGYFCYLYFDDNGNYLDIDFRTNRIGATCIIQQIGVEEKPVFEMVCADGAKEKTFQ